MSHFIRQLRARPLRSAVANESKFYATPRTPDEIRVWQLDQFNQIWSGISARIPFYKALVEERKMPPRFESWEQFRQVMPIADRSFVQRKKEELGDPSRPADFVRTTGGSTSEPVQLPAWRSELDFANADAWLARSWFGIDPSDKLFLIWGHSHQLGKGIRGKINALRRDFKDKLLGYRRWSAYDLSESAVRRAGDALLKFRPAWIMAYAVALDQLARVNADRAKEFAALNLKAALASAESFPRRDSAAQIARVLGCRVAMEYGAVESGAIAHQRADSRFQIFWRHWMVDGLPSADVPGAFEIFLTSLYPRKFPLIRYQIGDLITEDPNAPAFDQTFASVLGRCNDYISLPNGTHIHSEAFTHAVKECETVGRFQIAQSGTGKISFRYVAATEDAAVENEIRRRLTIVHPGLKDVAFEHVASLPHTIAGKTRTIVREESNERR